MGGEWGKMGSGDETEGGGGMILICHFFGRWVPQKEILCSQKQVSHTTLHVCPTDVDSCGGGGSASFNTRRRTRDSESQIHFF